MNQIVEPGSNWEKIFEENVEIPGIPKRTVEILKSKASSLKQRKSRNVC